MLRLWKELHILTLSTIPRKDSNMAGITAGTPHRTLDACAPSTAAASNANPASAFHHQIDGSDREVNTASPRNYGNFDTPKTAALLAGRNEDGDSVATSRTTIKPSDENMLLLEPNGRGAWRLKPNLRLHLYVSDPPCGDASIYEQASAAAAAAPPVPAHVSTCGKGDNSSTSATKQGEQHAPAVPVSPINKRVVEGCVCSSGDFEQGAASPSQPNAQARSSGERCNKRHRCTENKGCSSATSSSCCSIPLDRSRERGHTSSNELSHVPDTPVPTKRSMAPAADRMTFTGAKIAPTVGEDTALADDTLGGGSSGAKLRGAGDGAAMWAGDVSIPIVREREQCLGVLRIKSSRSNISEEGRTMSMSCSDKLAKWAVLGLQVNYLALVCSVLPHAIEHAHYCTCRRLDDQALKIACHV